MGDSPLSTELTSSLWLLTSPPSRWRGLLARIVSLGRSEAQRNQPHGAVLKFFETEGGRLAAVRYNWRTGEQVPVVVKELDTDSIGLEMPPARSVMRLVAAGQHFKGTWLPGGDQPVGIAMILTKYSGAMEIAR